MACDGYPDDVGPARAAARSIRSTGCDGSPELGGRGLHRGAAGLGQLALELGSGRVAVVDVQRSAVPRHHHRRGKRVDVKAVRKLALPNPRDLLDAPPPALA